MDREELNLEIRRLQLLGDKWQQNARLGYKLGSRSADKMQAKANECYEKAASLRLKEMGIS